MITFKIRCRVFAGNYCTLPDNELAALTNLKTTTLEPTSAINECRVNENRAALPFGENIKNIEIGTFKKKSETGKNYSSIECIINNNKTELFMLNSFPLEDLMLFIPEPERPYLNLGRSKVKYEKTHYFIYKGNNTVIKFGFIRHNNEDEELIAIKKYTFKESVTNNNQLKEYILKEADLQARAGSIAPKIYGLATNKTNNTIKGYIAMELCLGYPLSAYCYTTSADTPNQINEKNKLAIAIDIAKKLDQLHEKSIYHGDIKLNNIIMKRDGNLKIIDYGLSNDMKNPTPITFNPYEVQFYHAYEVYKAACSYHQGNQSGNKLTNPCKSDIYSLGVLLTYIFSPKPYMPQWFYYYKDISSCFTPEALYENNAGIVKSAKIPDSNVEALILDMVHISPEKRPDLKSTISILESSTLEFKEYEHS